MERDFEKRYTNTVVDHESVIVLKPDLKIARLETFVPVIPRCYFKLTNFAYVLTKAKGLRLLAGMQLTISFAKLIS